MQEKMQIASFVFRLSYRIYNSTIYKLFGFDDISRGGLFDILSQSSVRPSIYFSSMLKSSSKPFLEPTSSKQ